MEKEEKIALGQEVKPNAFPQVRPFETTANVVA
jgi:hypothetical protein